MILADSSIEINYINPVPKLTEYIENIWMLRNASDTEHNIIVLPDGRFDIIFSYSSKQPYHVMLMGLSTKPEPTIITPGLVMFAVSFKLLAIEYLLNLKAGSILNEAQPLPTDFWGITESDLNDFKNFCEKISANLLSLINPDVDNRKQTLFEQIYSSNGTMTVAELSEKVYWSSRQINRYFNQQFGISIKAYCSILRFWASLPHIKNGQLFPELNFTDQSHFIKEIKKFSGVVPKELSKNQNDRFILLSVLPKR